MANEIDLSQYFTALGDPVSTSGLSGPEEILGLSRSYLSGLTVGQAPKVEAALSSLIGPETYAQELAAINAQQAAYRQAHPVVSIGTEIAPSLVVNPFGAIGALGKGATIAGALKTFPTVAKYVEASPSLLNIAREAAPVITGIEGAIQKVPTGILLTKGLSSVPAQAAVEGALRAEGDQSMLLEGAKGAAYGTAGSVVSSVVGAGLGKLLNESDRLRLSAFGLNSQDVTRNIKKAEQMGVNVEKSIDVPILQTVKRLQAGGVIDPESEILQNITSIAGYQDDLGVELNSRLKDASAALPAVPEFNDSYSKRFTNSLVGKARDAAEKAVKEEREAIIRQMANGGTIDDLQRAKTGLNYVWDAKPYSEDVRKAIRADLRQEIEDRITLAEMGKLIAKGTSEEVKLINREWGHAADLKDIFARKAGKALGEDVVEGLFGAMRTSGGTGSLNIVSAVTGSPLFAVGGAALNAMRASAGKNYLADVLEDPLFQKVGSKLGKALEELGQGRAFAIGASRAGQTEAKPTSKDEAVKDTLVQGLRSLSANSSPEDVRKALEPFKRKAKAAEAPTKVDGATLGKVSYKPDDVKAAILAEDPFTQAMVSAESKGDPRAKSAVGAEGLLQLMPATAREVGVEDSTDYRQNLRGGKTYFAKMMTRYENDRKLALAAYNWGPRKVDAALARVKAKGLAESWENIKRYASVPAATENYVAYVMREQGKIRNNPNEYWDKIFSRREKQVKA